MKKNELFEIQLADGSKKVIGDGRHCCVVGVVVSQDKEGNAYILANKRGPGCPNEVGKWNMPCGYLDAGSGEENISREVYEETGILIEPDNFMEINHGDLSVSRNVTFRYLVVLEEMKEIPSLEEIQKLGGEKDEVSEVKWIPFDEVSNYDWAFNHDNIMAEVLNRFAEVVLNSMDI